MSRYWSITIPARICVFTCVPCDDFQYLTGQLEFGAGGLLHWQLYGVTSRKSRDSAVRKLIPGHIERSRSSAIVKYVSKPDTRIDGTFFEWGTKPVSGKRGGYDWSAIRDKAKKGEIESIPGYAYVSFYNTLRSIQRDHITAVGYTKEVYVFWGAPGTGKSHLAWEQAGQDAYPKDPCTKFWDGYRGQSHVVIDEFRGTVSISHILRWFDKYPCIVEVKGSSVALKATKIWITSNLNPRDWYKDMDSDTVDALIRRLNIIHFDSLIQ